MSKLIVFNQVTLDGYFAGVNGDISWAHRPEKDEEMDSFVADNARSENVLVFGRITYQLMASYWPTPQASQGDPVVAERMNTAQKVVFSRTLAEASWSNTRLVKDGLAAEIRKLKDSGKGLTLLGSGSLVSQLAQEGLIDEYQILLCPVVIGQGRTMFEGLQERMNLKLTTTRAFPKGNVLLSYEPATPA
jgi:dihydrofolate reductase